MIVVKCCCFFSSEPEMNGYDSVHPQLKEREREGGKEPVIHVT